MKIAGFNLTKINAEKLSGKLEGVRINTNIDIPKISKVNSETFKSDEQFLAVEFKYSINYDPNFAKIELSGTLLVMVDKSRADEILESWESKNLSDDFKYAIFNVVMKKSTLKALQLEEELNLPIHMPLPSLKPEGKTQ